MADGAAPPTELALQPFDRDELAELIETIEGERPSASVLLLVAERSRGNALVAEELLAARRELAGASLTGSLDELVMARLAQRTPECRRILRLVAPAGEPMRIDDLAATSAAFERSADRPAPRSSGAPRRGGGILEPDLAVGLVEAVEHGFLALDRHGARDIQDAGEADEVGLTPSAAAALPAEATVGFRHEVIAQAVEADLLPAQRRRHHSALAAGLGHRPGARARHHLVAHEPGPARIAPSRPPRSPRRSTRRATRSPTSSWPSSWTTGPSRRAARPPRARPPACSPGPGRRPSPTVGRPAPRRSPNPRSPAWTSGPTGWPWRSSTSGSAATGGAAGDQEGSIVAHRRAVELLPDEPTRERAAWSG